MPRWCRRVVAVGIGVLALSTEHPSPAAAHPTLLFTEPAAETAVADSPTMISLVFNERVTFGGRAIAVVRADGAGFATAEATAGRDGHVVTARVQQRLPPGTYVVRWRVTGTDGDTVDNEFRFAVGEAITGAAGGAAGPGISWPTVPLRWLLFAGLALALGGLVGERIVGSARAENPRLVAVRSPVAPAALAGFAAAGGLAVLLVADVGALEALWRERPGQVLLTEITGFAIAFGLTAVRRAGWAVIPLTAVAVAEGLRAHANTSSPGWGALATIVHLAAAAVWVGALLHIVRAALRWRAHPPAVRWVITEYARLAIWVFLTVVAAGTVTALLIIPLTAVPTTTYGRVLLIKLGLVAIAAGLALAARRALGRPERLARTRRSARAESVVLIGVLAVTATLVSTPTPAAPAEQPPPPPPRGVAIPLGGLAGQIGVTLTASDGQLVIRLTTPRRTNYYDPPQRPDYQLTGRITRAGADSAPLALRGCGQGCFLAPVTWRDGDNVVTLQASAPGWRGGDYAGLVPWPAQPADELLARTVTVMRGIDAIAVHEAATSDTSTDLPEPRQLLADGRTFLASVPYGAGTAPLAVQISRPPGPVRLAVGFPAEGRTAELTLDARGRITEEILTDGKHVIRRRLLYTE